VNGGLGEEAKTVLGSVEVTPTITKKKAEMIFLIFYYHLREKRDDATIHH
jgi:hypothetical protein